MSNSEGESHTPDHPKSHDDKDRCSGEGAASALEHMKSQRNQQRRLHAAADAGSEAVPSDS